jgi:NADPH:quinone reductase-like Zn-dependent oxidoreductase
VDVVLDPLGGNSFRTSYRLLAPLGRLVMYGVSSIVSGERRSMWRALTMVIRMPRFRPLRLMDSNRGVFGFNKAVDDAVLVPVAKTYRTVLPPPLNEAPTAICDSGGETS